MRVKVDTLYYLGNADMYIGVERIKVGKKKSVCEGEDP